MKILKLRFKNLNSLYGRWELDFTVPEYESGGIFAITGPTGSGKTTILDALSLALYGETPRLGKISQSTNEVMSRLSSDCFAEVEFESAKGSFCCSFSQKKAGNNPCGKLQGPKHEISDLSSGKIVEDKKSKVPAIVEGMTGMNYDRFKRSIMLAQGDFAVFLNSRPGDRAPVLEQITGTEIYTEISVKVHERKKYEQNILDGMEESLRSVNILSAEEESELNERLNSLNRDIGLVKEKAAETDGFIRWVENISRIEDEIARLNEENENIRVLKDNSAGDLSRLALFRKASGLKHIHDSLRQKKAQHSGEKEVFDKLSAEFPVMKEGYEKAVSEYDAALEGSTVSSQNLNESLESIKKARESDIIIGSCLKNISSALKALGEMKGKEEGHQAKISRISENISYLESETEKLSQYLSANERLKGLRENIAVIEERAKKYSACLGEESELNLKLNRSQKEIKTRREQLSGRQKELSEINIRLLECRVTNEELAEKMKNLLCGREIKDYYELERKYSGLSSHLKGALRCFDDSKSAEEKLSSLAAESERDDAELSSLRGKYSDLSGRKDEKAEFIRILEENYALASKIKSLDDERKKLVSGKPCPLCGSSEHPYAAEIPASDGMKSRIEGEKSLLEELSSQTAGTVSEIAVLESKIKSDKKRSEELFSGIIKLKADLAECLESAGMNPEDVGREDILKKAGFCDDELTKIRAVVGDYEPLHNKLGEADRELSGLLDESAATEKEISEAGYSLKEGVSAEEIISGDLMRVQEESESLSGTLENEFFSYAPEENLPEERGKIPLILREILSAYRKKEQDHEAFADKLAQCRADLEKFSALHADAVKMREDKSGEAKRLESELEVLKSRRADLFGDKNPDEEEGRLKNLADQAKALLLEKREEKDNLYSGIIKAESRMEGLGKIISDLECEVAALNEKFLSEIHSAGFESEAGFEEALIPESEAERIAAAEEKIRNDETRVKNLLSEKTGILATEREKNLTGIPADELRGVHQSLTERLKDLNVSVGEVFGRLKTNNEQKGLASGKLEEIEMQKKVLLRWEKLNELIGSHNGSKFRKFAQGLTFEILVIHANNQLRKMSDRYILVRNEFDPLELGIIDNYQAGELRSTKNLSGGESFIVSLALALGLSDMSGSRVRVDSLFLDEGFGTLDENALDIALDTLSGLQHEGKTIGVISHVPALKERISTRIKVQRKSGGRSIIDGPGCRKMA